MTINPADLLLVTCLRGLLLFALAAASAATLPRQEPALRHLLWFSSLLGLVVIPLVFSLTPGLAVPVPQGPASRSFAGVVIQVGAGQVFSPQTGSESFLPAAAETAHAVVPSLRVVLCVAWGLGAVLLVFRVAFSPFALRRLLRDATPVAPAAGRVRILRSSRCKGPFTFGLFRPVVVIPQSREADDERMSLLHELAHVQRWDVLTGRIAYLICCVFWFCPFAWIARWRMLVEQEKACDAAAARAAGSRGAYAQMLVRLCRDVSEPFPVSIATTRMIGKSSLEERVKAVLSLRTRRLTVNKSGLSVVGSCALVAMLALSLVRCLPSQAQTSPTPDVMVLSGENGSQMQILARGVTQADVPLLWPLSTPSQGRVGRITTGYGPMVDPFSHEQRMHEGIDIAWKEGTEIIAAARGVVSEVGFDATLGEHITIRHASGFETQYCHLMTAAKVSQGDTVQAGDVIGNLGSTGNSTGPHLHYAVFFQSHSVDPLSLVGAKVTLSTQM